MDQISSVKGFQQQWCEGGSKRLQHSAVLEHAENMSHEKAFDLHLKDIEFGIWEQTKKEQLLLSTISQQPIIHGIDFRNKKDFKQTKKKFESSYFLTKNEAPLSLFPKLISHEERQGAAFCNRTSGTLFLEYITRNLREGLK